MGETAPLWLGLLGAVTGIVGLLVSIASAWYTRRSALAAEGPAHPGIEVADHKWDNDNPGWYHIDVIVRNRTGDAWEIVNAKAGRFISEPIFSGYNRPYTGEDYEPKLTPFNEVPEDHLQRLVSIGRTIGPAGTAHFHGHGGDAVRFSLYLRLSAFSRSTNRLCVSLSLEAKTESVRHKVIAVKRRLKPINITAV